MSEKAFRTGKCPKCMEELTVPEDLASFSCMYCGARLSQDDLITSEMEQAAQAITPDEAEAAFCDAAAQLAGCVSGYPGYNRKITRDEFVPAFEIYEAGCAPVFRALDRAISSQSACREALLARAAKKMLDDLERGWKADKRWKSKQGQTAMLEDDKIIIAIFTVPMVRRMALPSSEDFCKVLQSEWVARYPKSPFYLGDYDSIAGGFRKKFLGLCFITTAVCEAEGLSDDCAQLTAFRAFRDGYLRACPDGAALIDEYYNIAPGIVSCINVCENRAEKYAEIRKTYLDACYDDILAGRNESCKQRYTEMVRALEKQYLS